MAQGHSCLSRPLAVSRACGTGARRGPFPPEAHGIPCRDSSAEDVFTLPVYFSSDWLNEYWDALDVDDYRFVYMGPAGSWYVCPLLIPFLCLARAPHTLPPPCLLRQGLRDAWAMGRLPGVPSLPAHFALGLSDGGGVSSWTCVCGRLPEEPDRLWFTRCQQEVPQVTVPCRHLPLLQLVCQHLWEEKVALLPSGAGRSPAGSPRRSAL